MIVGFKQIKNYPRTQGGKPCLVRENQKKIYLENIQPKKRVDKQMQ